jgi:hypothetical protein
MHSNFEHRERKGLGTVDHFDANRIPAAAAICSSDPVHCGVLTNSAHNPPANNLPHGDLKDAVFDAPQ